MRVEVVDPNVFVTVTVSVDVAPNSTYTVKTLLTFCEFVSISLEVYCGSRCWCHILMEESFQFCLEWKVTEKIDQVAKVIIWDIKKEKVFLNDCKNRISDLNYF